MVVLLLPGLVGKSTHLRRGLGALGGAGLLEQGEQRLDLGEDVWDGGGVR